jgi:putative ubiquitin-RnfH superfamily antitoxin RatB of RatAB toxin-antitoxin module
MDRAEAALKVSVAYSPCAGEVDLVELTLSEGTTLEQALRASGLAERHPEIDLAVLKVGIWGRNSSLDETLRDGDRVEIYRPLQVDPKEARRLRYRSHRERVKKGAG